HHAFIRGVVIVGVLEDKDPLPDAHLLGKARGITSGIEFEMLLGMATGQAEAVKRDVGSLLLYTPVVHPSEFDVAIAYLIRRLEEGASQENFMSAVFELDKNEALFEREKQRFLASLTALTDTVPGPNRVQDRTSFDTETALTEAMSRAALGAGGSGYGGPTMSFANTPVDRLLHHAHVCQTSGDSIRLTQALA
ncbi:proline dehydrogenase family protein, partial [Paenarthrobacter ureafaciens]|uniref:proline dehydrogenase family protein n=1 Tax=Paenarthrobacter ureafaciens TaxID=37931 RepID=UPI00397D16E9